MKEKNGFTLIELLAVIIILGVLMIIAVPSVTKYINESRKNGYVYTIKQIIGGARNLVYGGKLDLSDKNTMYYIDSKCIKTDNSLVSPYGEITKSYVIVTYANNKYIYYWVGVDETGTGIKEAVRLDMLDSDNIESNISESDINSSLGFNGREKYMIIDKNSNCSKTTSQDVSDDINPISKVNRKVDIDVTFDVDDPIIGDAAHFYARLTGYEDLNCTFQWQWSDDDITYHSIEGETSQNMDIIINNVNNLWWWKVLVYHEE